MVSISACHADDTGSIPGRGTFVKPQSIEEHKVAARRTAEKCRDPGSNRGPPDLQSDALPTELSRLEDYIGRTCPDQCHGLSLARSLCKVLELVARVSVAEWSKASDSSSDGANRVGSNPTADIIVESPLPEAPP